MFECKGKKIVVFLENMYNEPEFFYPRIRMQEAGATVTVAATEGGKVYHSKVGMPAASDVPFSGVNAKNYDGLIIPGGYAPDIMRASKDCLDLVRAFHEQGKLVAFICHAGWVPASAGIIKGKKVTSCASIKDDMTNAGGIWQDTSMVQDGNLISSRTPADLPDFMRAVIAFLTK